MLNVIDFEGKHIVLDPVLVSAYCAFTYDTDEIFKRVATTLLCSMDPTLPETTLARQVETQLKAEMEMLG